MKDILGHRSWSEQEILAFFDNDSFTMCSLPHYRYQRVQMVCGNLKRCGLIGKVGSTETGINYAAKPEYHQWRQDVAAGKATGNLNKLFKLMNPPRLLTRTCHQCDIKFETFNHVQKFCSKKCKSEAKAHLSYRKEAVC
jgi:hypothetical protein